MRGYTMVETTVSAAVILLIFGIFGGLTLNTSNHAQASQRQVRASLEHHGDLELLREVFQGVVADSLGGFDTQGRSTAPTFQRLVDAEDGVVALSGTERVFWMDNGVWWRSDSGDERQILRDVDVNGFEVVRRGRRLLLRVVTVKDVEGYEPQREDTWTAVVMRN